MNFEDYKIFLEKKNWVSQRISNALLLMDDFRKFIETKGKSLDSLGYDDFYAFTELLIENKENTSDNFVSILYYGYYTRNEDLIIAVMETLDGWEMFPNFEKQLIETYGKKVRDEIFGEISLPPPGIHPKKKPMIIKTLVTRFIEKFGPDESIDFFKIGLRDKYLDSYKNPKKKYEASQNLDEYLKVKHQSLIETLTKHYQEKSLFFTQPVDKQVLEFVKNDQQISAGIRDGNKILMYKIPYMTKQALTETDRKKRNYFVCHNPLIREALLEEEQPISPIFCNCSGGYLKNFWEAMFDLPVDVELVDSVIMGGEFCKFAIHLPPEIMDKINEV